MSGLTLESEEIPLLRIPREEPKHRLAISFSGGATSGMMVRHLLYLYPDKEIMIHFCNTGREHEKTLEFVDQCDREWGLGLVWLEAAVDHSGRGPKHGTKHKIVSFETASRDGEPFEEVIKKYGIPNKSYGHCNRELKLRVMTSHLRSIGWESGSYSAAVGIRSDELDRISIHAMRTMGVFYPLLDAGITKMDVVMFWEAQAFKLDIPEHWGNCLTCHKKSDRKLLTIAKDHSEAFAWNERMEAQYSGCGAGEGLRRFFRGNRSTKEILERSRMPFEPFVDGRFIDWDPELDVGGGCGDSCEVGADDSDYFSTDLFES